MSANWRFLELERARLRSERRERSRTLQAAMHASRGLLSFAGRYAPLSEFFPVGIPTGTGIQYLEFHPAGDHAFGPNIKNNA